MSFFHRLLQRLFGIDQSPVKRTNHYNHELYCHIAVLAEQERLTPQEFTEQLLSQALIQRETAHDTWQRWNSLSPREQQVAGWACLGYANAEIANMLGISIDTVKTHIRNILNKFAVTNRRELGMLLSGWNFDEWLPPRAGE